MNNPTSARRLPGGRARSASMSVTPRRLPRSPPPFLKRSFFTTKPFPYHPKAQFTSTTPLARPQSPPNEYPIYLSQASVLLPPSLEPLDLPPTQISLPGLRDVFLSNLTELETRLSDLEKESSPHLTDVLAEGSALVREGLEFLEWLKSEVGAHMPDVDFDFEFASGVRSHLPDFQDVTSHLPDFDFDFDVRSKLQHVSTTFDDARTRFGHLDLTLPSLPDPQEYTTTLQARLSSVRDHLLAVSLPSTSGLQFPSLSPPKVLTDLLPDLLGNAEEEEECHTPVSERALQVIAALKSSCNGVQLIRYSDLPFKWKNNEHIHHGYRFIPFSSWKSLVLSVFKLHNETLNIHTHMIPLLSLISLALPFFQLSQLVPNAISAFFPPLPFTFPSLVSPSSILDVDPVPRFLFLIAAAMCLACSSLWHLSSGCADVWVLETGARTDYVGIGWLISASAATIVYYGFDCHPIWLVAYIGLTMLTGLAGSIAPFQPWFDQRKNKMKRVAFFLVLAGSTIIPCLHLGFLKGLGPMFQFVAPVAPSIAAYLFGLMFYATHFPECLFPGRFDYCGSHAIWHIFIVIAIRAHWHAVEIFQSHVNNAVCSM